MYPSPRRVYVVVPLKNPHSVLTTTFPIGSPPDRPMCKCDSENIDMGNEGLGKAKRVFFWVI